MHGERRRDADDPVFTFWHCTIAAAAVRPARRLPEMGMHVAQDLAQDQARF